MTRRNLNTEEKAAIDMLGFCNSTMRRDEFCGSIAYSVYVGAKWKMDISEATYNNLIAKKLVKEASIGYEINQAGLKVSK